MLRTLALVMVLAQGRGWAQSTPDEDWQPLPNAPAPTVVPAAPLVPPPPPPQADVSASAVPGRLSPEALRTRLRPREEPNTVSMFGAPSLGQWKRGQAFTLGFPFFQLRASLGLLDNLDVGIGFDSFYLLLNEVRLLARYGFGKGTGVTFAFVFEGGAAFFNQRASREVRGTRWISGRRNFNFVPGVVLSYQGSALRAARLHVDLRYMLTVDTEPFAMTPLEGVPASFIIGHNVLLKVGAELPLSERTSFLFSLGLDLHFRRDDSPAMPTVAIGVITGF